MKTIYLIRHAKSSWKNNEARDIDRTLNARGKQDRNTMGKRLADENCNPQTFISSIAKRTQETSVEIAKEIGFNTSDIVYKENLYMASYQEMLTEINGQDNAAKVLLMVAHNPGTSDLCYYLTEEPIQFPTCGVAKIIFETDNWMEISGGTGSLEFFDYPKNES